MMTETPIWDDMLRDGYADEHEHALQLKDRITEARTWEPKGPEDDDSRRLGTEEPPVHATGVGSGTDDHARGADADGAPAGVPAGRGRQRTTPSARRKGTPRRTRPQPVGDTGGDGPASPSDPVVRSSAS